MVKHVLCAKVFTNVYAPSNVNLWFNSNYISQRAALAKNSSSYRVGKYRGQYRQFICHVLNYLCYVTLHSRTSCTRT